MKSVLFGVYYLAVGLTLSATIVSRLVQYWDRFVNAQRLTLLGILVMMFAWTQRGIELLWFEAPGVRPAGYVAVVGGALCLYAMLIPVEESRLKPAPWRDSLRVQEPDIADKYLEILARSQTNRKLDKNSESTVDNGFDARHTESN